MSRFRLVGVWKEKCAQMKLRMQMNQTTRINMSLCDGDFDELAMRIASSEALINLVIHGKHRTCSKFGRIVGCFELRRRNKLLAFIFFRATRVRAISTLLALKLRPQF